VSKWVFVCNGGPGDRTVGSTAKSLKAACESLSSMMTSLGASIGQVYREDMIDKPGDFVESEDE